MKFIALPSWKGYYCSHKPSPPKISFFEIQARFKSIRVSHNDSISHPLGVHEIS